MRLNALGSAAMGTSVVSIDGATPAALVGLVAGSQFGPAWLTNTEILFQTGGTGSGPWQVKKYNTGTLVLSLVSATGQNTLAAGNSAWAKFLVGTGVTTSIGVGPFASAALGDVSTDHGEVAIVLDYASGTGLRVYSSAGATLLTVASAVLTIPLIRVRGHLLAYCTSTGWTLANVTGGSVSFAPRLNEPINWITPVVLASGKTLVMERSNRLTLRYADRGLGWDLSSIAPLAYNPDVIEYASGVVRLGWSTNQGESADALAMVDLTLATGATSVGTVSGGGVVWVAGATLASQTFSVGPVQGSGNTQGLNPPVRQPVTDPKSGLMDPTWQDWTQRVSQTATGSQTAIAAIPPTTPVNAISTIAAAGQVPIVANGPTTLTVTGVSLDPATNTMTITGLGGTVTHTGTLTANALILGNGGADIKPAASLGTTTTLLHGNAAGAPTFGAVSLTADVAGRLPYANLVASTAASRLLLRTSGSAGDWQEGTIDTDLVLTGTVLSTQAGLKRVIVPIANADIKKLPSVPYLLVAAPASGFRINVHRASVVKKSGGGAYTGIDATYATLVIQTTGGSWLTNTIANDSGLTIPVTRLTDFLGGANEKLGQFAGPYFEALQSGGSGDWGYIQPSVGSALADYDAAAIYLALDNNGSATDLGGGHAANTLTVTLFYTLDAV